MPEIGEIVKGTDIGRKAGSNKYLKYIWQNCSGCGKERWVRLRKGIPRYQYCLKCSLVNRDTHHGWSWKGGRSETSSGYVLVCVPGHPRASRHGNYVFEQIIVWEKLNGKSLPEGWVVHHINGRKGDNRPQNLMAMPFKNHHSDFLLQATRKRVRELEDQIKRLECQGTLL